MRSAFVGLLTAVLIVIGHCEHARADAFAEAYSVGPSETASGETSASASSFGSEVFPDSAGNPRTYFSSAAAGVAATAGGGFAHTILNVTNHPVPDPLVQSSAAATSTVEDELVFDGNRGSGPVNVRVTMSASGSGHSNLGRVAASIGSAYASAEISVFGTERKGATSGVSVVGTDVLPAIDTRQFTVSVAGNRARVESTLRAGGYIATGGGGSWDLDADISSSISIESMTNGVKTKLNSTLLPADILDDAVTIDRSDPTTMTMRFVPRFGLTIDEAAEALNVDHFNWLSWVVEDTDPNRPRTNDGVLPDVPYLDPPFGGWKYSGGKHSAEDNLPGYWDENGNGELSLAKHIKNSDTTLEFIDPPGVTEGSDVLVRFKTALMGVDKNGEPLLIRPSDYAEWYATSEGIFAGLFPLEHLDSRDLTFLASLGVQVVPEPSTFGLCAILVICRCLMRVRCSCSRTKELF